MKLKLFERETTTKFDITPWSNQVESLANEAIIMDAKIIYTLFARENSCIDWKENKSIFCKKEIHNWATLFRNIAESNDVNNPFDDLKYLCLQRLTTDKPRFIVEKDDLEWYGQNFFSSHQDSLANIEKKIIQFQQNYRNYFNIYFYWIDLNYRIRINLMTIIHFIEKDFESQKTDDPIVPLTEDEIIKLKEARQLMNAMVCTLNVLVGINTLKKNDGTVSFASAGYTHLNEELKFIYNSLPNILEELECSFSILTNYAKNNSIEAYYTSPINQLKHRVNYLKQGSVPNEKDDSLKNELLEELRSFNGWSKFCLPRSDFQYPTLSMQM